MGRIAVRFARVEPRRRVRGLVLGLLSDLPRKNCWSIAEWAGEATPGLAPPCAGAYRKALSPEQRSPPQTPSLPGVMRASSRDSAEGPACRSHSGAHSACERPGRRKVRLYSWAACRKVSGPASSRAAKISEA